MTARFDTETIEEVALPAADVLGQVSLLGKFAISIVAALIVFGGCGLVSGWQEVLGGKASERARPLWLYFSAHLIGAGAFYLLTAGLLEGGLLQRSTSLAWIAAWTAGGTVSVVAWALLLLPLGVWKLVFVQLRGWLLVGAALGAGAVLAGKAADFFWPLLSAPTLDAVGFVLSPFYDDVLIRHEEFLIRVRDFTAIVDAECSGFEGVGLVAIFLSVFLWSLRSRLCFPQCLVILPLGMIAIWLANLIRLTALVVIGASYSAEIAMGGFHSQAGWLAFNAVTLGIVYIVWNQAIFRDSTTDLDSQMRYEYTAGPYLAPLLMLVAGMMVTTAMSAADFDWLYPVRVVATMAILAWFWPIYRKRGYVAWAWSWTASTIGVAVFALWMLLEPLSPTDVSATTRQANALSTVSPFAAALWLVFRSIGSIFVVPMAEELAFRGYLTRRFISDDFEDVPPGTFSWASFLLSSLLFGLLHGRWFAGTLAGGLFAFALYRRGRLVDAIIAHATANALVTTYVLSTQNWSAWS